MPRPRTGKRYDAANVIDDGHRICYVGQVRSQGAKRDIKVGTTRGFHLDKKLLTCDGYFLKELGTRRVFIKFCQIISAFIYDLLDGNYCILLFQARSGRVKCSAFAEKCQEPLHVSRFAIVGRMVHRNVPRK